jgi:hypothetical protein
MYSDLREPFDKQGFVPLTGFLNNKDIEPVRGDAKRVFLDQMASRGFVAQPDVGECEFVRGSFRYFSEDADQLETPRYFGDLLQITSHQDWHVGSLDTIAIWEATRGYFK